MKEGCTYFLPANVHGVGPQGKRAVTADTFYKLCGKSQNRPPLAVTHQRVVKRFSDLMLFLFFEILLLKL